MKSKLDKVFNQYWSPYAAMGIAGILSAAYFGITGTVWAVTGEFTVWRPHLGDVRRRYFRLGLL